MPQRQGSYIRMHRVDGSSNVRSVGYSVRNSELAIRFKSTPQRYVYSDVPVSLYKDMLTAPSKGKYVHQNIKGYYPYRRENYTGEEYGGEDTMPSKSQSQQRYFGWLYSKKKSGDTTGMSERDIKTMENMNMDQIRDFAATKRLGLPMVLKPDMQKAASHIVKEALTYNRIMSALGSRLSGVQRGNSNWGNRTMNQLISPKDVPTLLKTDKQVGNIKSYLGNRVNRLPVSMQQSGAKVLDDTLNMPVPMPGQGRMSFNDTAGHLKNMITDTAHGGESAAKSLLGL